MKTNEELIAAWDAGEAITTVEMGGLGRGYENVIQDMGIEILRAMVEQPPKDGWESIKENEKWKEYSDMIERLPAVRESINYHGPTGAQFYAALNLASVFALNGYEKGLSMVEEDRRIVFKKIPREVAA